LKGALAISALPSSRQFADKISSATRISIAKPGGNMWLDLLVASGMGLPAMVYGSVLFLNYMQ
jgi:hypothetical protein